MDVTKLDFTFSRWVRLSNIGSGGVKCFTCDAVLPWGEIQNGHFIRRGNMATRFSEINCKPQCEKCNRDCNSGGEKQDVFEVELRRIYGDVVIDQLILESRLVKKWTQWEIDEMEKYYENEIKLIQSTL